jgi:hypothetical protein
VLDSFHVVKINKRFTEKFCSEVKFDEFIFLRDNELWELKTSVAMLFFAKNANLL